MKVLRWTAKTEGVEIKDRHTTPDQAELLRLANTYGLTGDELIEQACMKALQGNECAEHVFENPHLDPVNDHEEILAEGQRRAAALPRQVVEVAG